MTYDDEQCPQRGPGLTHTGSGTPVCVHCGSSIVHREWSPPRVAPTEPPRRPVPACYWRAYLALRNEGMTDADAESVLCLRHGLSLGDGQRQRWTLWELARLDELAWRVAQGLDP